MSLDVHVGTDVRLFLRQLSDKDRRIVGEHIDRLAAHPDVPGNVKKLHTRKPRWRMHISSKYTVFYFVEGDVVYVDKIMSQEQAHKRYGAV
jgi:mRNA-degrading endonuclease RelE of RelBE toxin-antitoxin system